MTVGELTKELLVVVLDREYSAGRVLLPSEKCGEQITERVVIVDRNEYYKAGRPCGVEHHVGADRLGPVDAGESLPLGDLIHQAVDQIAFLAGGREDVLQ